MARTESSRPKTIPWRSRPRKKAAFHAQEKTKQRSLPRHRRTIEKRRTSNNKTTQADASAFSSSSSSSSPNVPSESSLAQKSTQAVGAFSVPPGYGDDKVVLMVKDPWWLYAYWEIQPSTERAARGQLLPHEVAGLESILRVYDVTNHSVTPAGFPHSGTGIPSQSANRFFDIAISGLATSWYIHTNSPGQAFVVDFGILTQGGRFLALARSNPVMTPREGLLEIIGASGNAKGAASSRGPKSIKREAAQGLHPRVETELIFYGSVQPGSYVKIDGQMIPVRKDGTFSVRLSLPEGTRTLSVDVLSADGNHTHTITEVLSRTRSYASLKDKSFPRDSGHINLNNLKESA